MFSIGDQVILNSGGPVMTVIGVEAGDPNDHAWCRWNRSNGTTDRGSFPQAALKKHSETVSSVASGGGLVSAGSVRLTLAKITEDEESKTAINAMITGRLVEFHKTLVERGEIPTVDPERKIRILNEDATFKLPPIVPFRQHPSLTLGQYVGYVYRFKYYNCTNCEKTPKFDDSLRESGPYAGFGRILSFIEKEIAIIDGSCVVLVPSVDVFNSYEEAAKAIGA